jgi:hypothetical protein
MLTVACIKVKEEKGETRWDEKERNKKKKGRKHTE